MKATRELLKLSSFDKLEGLEKSICLNCKRRRMYFCYDCRMPLEGVFKPEVQLPCLVDVIKHPKEKNSKSTAVHCKILAPSQTQFYHLPEIPDYKTLRTEENIVLVFPSPSAISVEEYVKKHGKIHRFVVLDSTWFQASTMQKIPEVQGLPCVRLQNYKTAFWRPQHNLDDYHLATIEAIYFALKEYVEALSQSYSGEFDDLLFYFMLVRDKYDDRESDYLKRKAQEDDKIAQNPNVEPKRVRAKLR